MAKNRYGATSAFEIGPPVTAVGSSITDAARLRRGFQTVSGANGTVGVKLPGPDKTKAGDVVIIKGITNGVLKVYPGSAATGAKINALSDGAAMSLASELIPATFIAASDLQWYSVPLLPS